MTILSSFLVAFFFYFFYSGNFKDMLTRFHYISSISVSEIIKNPEKYLNKEVTIVGYTSFGNFLVDDQGYSIKLVNCKERGRTILPGKYKVTGVLHFIEICECEERRVLNVTEEEWMELQKLFPNIQKNQISQTYLILPSPEEGWLPAWSLPTPEIVEAHYYPFKAITIKENCVSEIIEKNYTTTVMWRFKPVVEITTELILERRCKPNTIERYFYFNCTKSMEKIE